MLCGFGVNWMVRGLVSCWAPWLRLGVCVGVIGVVWGSVLPRIERVPGIDSYIHRNERLGIDPSAKFYTELPLMPSVLDRVESKQRRGNYIMVAAPAKRERAYSAGQ